MVVCFVANLIMYFIPVTIVGIKLQTKRKISNAGFQETPSEADLFYPNFDPVPVKNDHIMLKRRDLILNY